QGGAPQSVAQRLAKWKRVEMPFHAEGLSARERQMVQKLVEATRLLDQAFWRQSDVTGYSLFQSTPDQSLRRLLGIMGGRWDLADDHRPFTGQTPMPPGLEVYPHDLTRAEVERYVAQHPEDRDAIYAPYTVVKRQGARLAAVPYHAEYRNV